MAGMGSGPLETDTLTVSGTPALEHEMYLFSSMTGKGPVNMTVLISPSLNYLANQTPLEYGVALYPSDQ